MPWNNIARWFNGIFNDILIHILYIFMTAHYLLKKYYDLINNTPKCISLLQEWQDQFKKLNEEIIEFFKIKNPHANKY